MRMGLGMGLGVGRGPTGPAYFVGSSLSGNTLDLDAGIAYNTSTGAWTDQSGAGNSLAVAGGTKPTATTVGGFAALDFNGTTQFLTGSDITAVITASAYTLFAVVYIDAIDSADAASTHNDGVLTCSNGVFGMCLKNTPKLQAAQFDGAFKQSEKAVTTGALTLLAMRFKSGTILASVNGTDGTGASSGSIVALTGGWDVGQAGQGPNFFDGKILRLLGYNVGLSDANWAAAKAALIAYYGIV